MGGAFLCNGKERRNDAFRNEKEGLEPYRRAESQ